MKLYDFINRHALITREQFIGIETVIADKPAFLLSLFESIDMDVDEDDEPIGGFGIYSSDSRLDISPAFSEEESEIMTTKLIALCEIDPVDFSEDDEYEENMTNRDSLMLEFRENPEISAAEVSAFIVNGTRFDVLCGGMEELEFSSSYQCMSMLMKLADKGMIPESWMEKDIRSLCITEYEVDPSIFDSDIDKETTNISVEMEIPPETGFIGTRYTFSRGHYDIPMCLSAVDSNGNDINFKVHGVFSLTYDDMLSDFRETLNGTYDEDELQEFEEDIPHLFSDNDSFLIVDYSTDNDTQLNFYSREYLDAPDGEVFLPCLIMLGNENSEETRRISIAGVNQGQQSGEVTIELFSYVKFS